jgi:hypothetical protein
MLPPKTGQERQKFFAGHLKERRRTSVVKFIQAVPGSKLRKFYTILFDTQPDGHPRPDWRPRFVIIWKAENFKSISFGPIHSTTVWINEHLIQPPSGKNAFYALQPDYSIQQLPLTEEETNRLFSYITTVEKQTDKRVASLVDLIKRDDPHWEEKVSAEIIEEEQFPSDLYWEQKVDPHLKIVEPPLLSLHDQRPPPSTVVER